MWVSRIQHDQSIVQLVDPTSGTYDLAFISLSGEEWKWTRNTQSNEIRPTQWTINIVKGGKDLQAITASIDSGRAEPNVVPDLAADHRLLPGQHVTRLNEMVTAENLAAFLPANQTSGPGRDATIMEMQQLIDLATALASDDPLPRIPDMTTEQLLTYEGLPELSDSFQSIGAYKKQYSFTNTQPLPIWPTWLILGFGVAGLLLGILIIRQKTYHKMAVDGIPQLETIPLATLMPTDQTMDEDPAPQRV